MRHRVLSRVGLFILAIMVAEPTFGADPNAVRTAAAPPGAYAAIVVAREAGPERMMKAAELAALPVSRVTIPADAGHGTPRSFEGPLLWTVLNRAGAVDATRMRDAVRQIVLVTGRDGYSAVLALGEIAPAFEDKQVLIAERVDGQPLGPGHLRLVIPGDRRGGRGVHDLVRIVLSDPAAGPR